MQVQDYTEKSIVVFGDKTNEYKDGIKAMGGKFNMKLSVGPGWVFPKTKKEEVEKYIQECLSGKVTTTPVEKKEKPTYLTKTTHETLDQGVVLNKIYEKLDEIYLLLKSLEKSKNVNEDESKKNLQKSKIQTRIEESKEEEEFEEVVYEEEIVDTNPKKFKL